MATQTLISLEEYLNRFPDPDVEYVDGYLKERPVHGLCTACFSPKFVSGPKS